MRGGRPSEKGRCVFRRPVWLLGKGVILNDLSVGGNETARCSPVLPDADARFKFSGVSHDRTGIIMLPFRIFRRPQNQVWGRRAYPNPMSNPMFSDGLGLWRPLDSHFKCNTRVPVVGTDSRIKHLAFRSQEFFSAGGSTHLEPCVSPDH